MLKLSSGPLLIYFFNKSSFLFSSTTVIQNVNKAQVKIRAKKDNVAGNWPAPRVPGGVMVTFGASQLHDNIAVS